MPLLAGDVKALARQWDERERRQTRGTKMTKTTKQLTWRVYTEPERVAKERDEARAKLKRELRRQVEAMLAEEPEARRMFAKAMKGEPAESRLAAAGAREIGGEATALLIERADGSESRIGGDTKGGRASFEDVFARPAVQPDGSRFQH
jgi:hypothetical protein